MIRSKRQACRLLPAASASASHTRRHLSKVISSKTTMPAISPTIHSGILDLPGATNASKVATERLLKIDEESHHCYFNTTGFHNHLSHHILAAYDLGAPATLLEAIFDEEAKMQRPVDLKLDGVTPEATPRPGEIQKDNWTQWLGDQKAYQAYLTFFSDQVSSLGIAKTLENYIFSPAANGNDSNMLLRVVGGALHPVIQIGYGLEFGSEMVVAAGIAQAAIHESQPSLYMSPDQFVEPTSSVNRSHLAKGRQPRDGPSLLLLMRQIYDNPKLTPVLPYDPNAVLSKRVRDFAEGGTRVAELHGILAQFDPGSTPEAIDARVEEFIFVSTLIAFGTGKPHRKPRVDFFLMHLLTSSLFVPSFLKYIPNPAYKKAFLRTYIQAWGVILMIRGRPRIDPKLLMSYTDSPVPPNTLGPQPNAIGGHVTNAWPAIIADVLHAPDSHTIKSVRTLLYGATKYGTLTKGDVIGAWGPDGTETHPGIGELDGTVFVRAAGVLMDTLGWVTHGSAEGNWDRSALGWDDAWKGDD